MMTYEGGLLDPREGMIGRVGGWTKKATATVQRPANATGYVTGDVIADETTGASVLEILDCARRPGGSGVILDVQLVDSANQGTHADLELWLFTAEPGADNDNTPFSPTDAELRSLVGIADLGSAPIVGALGGGAAGNCVYTVANFDRGFRCAAGSKGLWAVIVVRNSYTPVSEEEFTVVLGILQD